MAEGAFRIGSVVGRSASVLGKNIVPFGLLYLVINAPSALYALNASGRGGSRYDRQHAGLRADYRRHGGNGGHHLWDRGRRLSFGAFVRGGLAQGGAAIRVAILSGIGILLGLIALVIPGFFFYTVWWVAV